MATDPGSVVSRDDRGPYRLNPLPTDSQLHSFYADTYYSGNEGKAPDVARLRTESDAANAERHWRAQTIYSDVLHYLRSAVGESGRVVDVGCGTGEFVAFMGDATGWDASGVELAPDAVALAQSRGLAVRQGTIDEVSGAYGEQFDALTMFNVLEHLLDPWQALSTAHDLVRPGGVIVVQVPNDFSRLQEAVRAHLDVDPWWIAIPDHVNYFDFETLEAFLTDHNFEPLIRYGSFPMEFFLLGGYNYVTNSDAGAQAHQSRCAFELSMTGPQRRSLFESFARGGIGRNAVVVARKAAAASC